LTFKGKLSKTRLLCCLLTPCQLC